MQSIFFNLVVVLLAFWAQPGNALTDAEIDLFYADSSIAVSAGTLNGATFYPSLSVTKGSDSITVLANHIPPHATASAYTRPITTYISPQSGSYTLPLNPSVAESSTCLPAGVVGIAVDGVSIFSAYSRPCTDAVKDEAIGFDSCDGHPQEQGAYHYHYKGDCAQDKNGDFVTKNQTTEKFFGVLLDGFPVYNSYDANGSKITNDQLDSCHGYDPGTGYRYIVNDEFPYIVGCFKGKPLSSVICHCSGSGRFPWPVVIGASVVGCLAVACICIVVRKKLKAAAPPRADRTEEGMELRA